LQQENLICAINQRLTSYFSATFFIYNLKAALGWLWPRKAE